MGRIRALADDSMLGRGPGQRGDTLTTRYLEREMSRIGLAPAGGAGFRQPVRINRSAGKASFRITAGEREIRLAPDSQIFINATRTGSRKLDAAPIVFVGHGIDAPEFRWNDYKSRLSIISLSSSTGNAAACSESFSKVRSHYHSIGFRRARYAMARGASGRAHVRRVLIRVTSKRARASLTRRVDRHVRQRSGALMS